MVLRKAGVCPLQKKVRFHLYNNTRKHKKNINYNLKETNSVDPEQKCSWTEFLEKKTQ